MTNQTLGALERIRTEIESIDHDIIDLLGRRLDLCRQVAPLKVAAGLEAHIPHRVKLVIERWTDDASTRGIDPQLIRSLCEQIIAEGEKLQNDAMKLARGSSH